MHIFEKCAAQSVTAAETPPRAKHASPQVQTFNSTLCRESERRSRRRECERCCCATKTDQHFGARANGKSVYALLTFNSDAPQS
ncbi:hypothetical protein ACLKA7_001956 [Drosophila subpalustris]